MKALEVLRRERGLGTSAAINELVRRGLVAGTTLPQRFTQRTSNMGESRVPLDDIGSAFDVALAFDHGVAAVSTDADFAQFREVAWVNPLG